MLIIEDDDLSIKVMRRIFQTNFEVFICESAEEYYEKYSNADYNIILMDISLKGKKNGLELIKEIKEAPKYTGTPILCLTAHAQTKIRQTAIDSGSDLFITKPVSNKILKEAVEFLLKSKKAKIK
jgi:two-component system, OmpR family, aerobic respiration control sensor histidine kinase ArcB